MMRNARWNDDEIAMIRGKIEQYDGKIPDDIQAAMADQLKRTKSAVYQRIRIEARKKISAIVPNKSDGSIGSDGNTYMLATG
jgi:hypothetical protein